MKENLPKSTVIKTCDECGSEYFAHRSRMDNLCPECAHILYGYENCMHQFENHRCRICYWDGSSTAYINKLKIEKNKGGK